MVLIASRFVMYSLVGATIPRRDMAEFSNTASLAQLDAAIADLQAARARRFPSSATVSAQHAVLPMCGWEKPVNDQCVDPCPACLGYPVGQPEQYPVNQSFVAWAVYSRPITSWEHENIDTGLTSVDENPASIGPNDEIIVQGSEKLYSSKDGGYTWGDFCSTDTKFPPGWGDIGIGYLSDGTVLGAAQADGKPINGSPGTPRGAIDVYKISRADNGSCSWPPPFRMYPTDPTNGLTDSPGRFVEDPGDHTVYFAPQQLCGAAEGAQPNGRADECVNGVLFASTDLGKTFKFRGLIGRVAGLAPNISARVNSCSEPDVLPLGNGTILAACRFQNDPCSLVYYSNAGITVSHDRGVSWSVTGLLTGWAQQDGSLLKLHDGTIVMPFAHKDKGYGQRALFSYDNGSTWSTNIYEIHKGGLYADSVLLKSGTIVTPTAVYPGDADPFANATGPLATLHAIRWIPPTKKEVSKGGFMSPLIPPPMYNASGFNLVAGGCTIH